MSSRSSRGKAARLILKIRSDPEQHKRSRSSSLPKSKKRSIGDMEAADTSEIRPSTSRDAHRRSQKGSPTKIKRSSRSKTSETGGARPRILSNSPPSSPVRSVSKRPKTKIKSSLKSPKKTNRRFRDMVMDEGADSRQLLRQMEEKSGAWERKSKELKVELRKEQERTKFLLEANQKLEKTAKKDRETHCEEKISMEKELNKLKKRLEKSELDLTMAKSLQTSGGSDQNGGEAFFQDVMGNLQDFLDNQLQCTICSEVYLVATVINCGHTFCEECIEVWKTKQSNGTTCPICRKEIIMTSTNQALDACIEKFIDNFYPEAAKVTRTELVSERTAKKEARIANQGKKENNPTHHRHRILLRPGNFSSDEEDNWGNELPIEPLEQLARLDMSPSRFSMSSISIASTRSFLGSDLDGRDTPPSPELNVTFFSDDSDSTDVDYDPRANNITIDLGGSDSDASTQFSLSNASEYPETPDNNSTDDENDSIAVNNESDDEDDSDDVAKFSDSDSD